MTNVGTGAHTCSSWHTVAGGQGCSAHGEGAPRGRQAEAHTMCRAGPHPRGDTPPRHTPRGQGEEAARHTGGRDRHMEAEPGRQK